MDRYQQFHLREEFWRSQVHRIDSSKLIVPTTFDRIAGSETNGVV
jgi:hypothetical protein